ncbi:Endonuclease/exonuclease/phosphatase, partial [Cristinia sonorae]
IRLATLNIKGYGNPDTHHPKNKWNHLNQVLRDDKIAILAVQESHMTPERVVNVEERFSSRMRIFMSAHPEAPTAKGGVALVLNKQLIDAAQASAQEVVPGRALLVRAKTYKDEWLNILAVYAPNIPAENGAFWDTVSSWFDDHDAPNPDIMLGDFNMVEEAADRLPAHEDSPVATLAFNDLKTKLHLCDGWRNTFPTDNTKFTYHQPNMTVKSRIDRIYMKRILVEMARDWVIKNSGIETDHEMVCVDVITKSAPLIGPGRWSIPTYLISDKPLVKYINERGLEAEKELDQMNERTADKNPQTIWYKFKRDILDMAKKRQSKTLPQIVKEMNVLETEIRKVHGDSMLTEEQHIQKTWLNGPINGRYDS